MSFTSPTIVYVLGVSRSGSTVLSFALGAHEDACSVGEIAFTPHRGWVNGRRCSCGEQWDRCGFWTIVRDGLERTLEGFDVAEYARLQRRFEPYPLDGRGWARLAREATRQTVEFRRYSEIQRALFGSIAEASGKRVIVDSSKDPGRAMSLALVRGLDVRIVHVVRDARGVAYSMAKRFDKDPAKAIHVADPGEPLLKSATLWTLVNSLSEMARCAVSSGRSARVRYEDFAVQPAEELSRLSKTIGLDYRDVAAALEEAKPLSVGHVLNGNRVRVGGTVHLRLDEEWTRRLDRWDRLRVDAASAALQLRYGYCPFRSPPGGARCNMPPARSSPQT